MSVDLRFPDDARTIQTWANGGVVATAELEREMREWYEYLFPMEAAAKAEVPRPKTGPWLRRRDKNGDWLR